MAMAMSGRRRGTTRYKSNNNNTNSNNNHNNNNNNKTKNTIVAHPQSNNRNRPLKSKPTAHKRRHNATTSTKNRIQKSLHPIRISQSSIHSSWKKELGGIIRYYINIVSSRSTTTSKSNGNLNKNKLDAEQDIERMYYASGCSIPETKTAILRALDTLYSGHSNNNSKAVKNSNAATTNCMMDDEENWINLSMAVETNHLPLNNNNDSDSDDDNDNPFANYPQTCDSKGHILPTIHLPGEGPAYSNDRWKNVIIPPRAVGQSFFFQLENNTVVDLSCEITLDGEHRVAKNVPLPKRSVRTVRPDNNRYFEMHRWVLSAAKRVGLHHSQSQEPTSSSSKKKKETKKSPSILNTIKPVSQRYNQIRPTHHKNRVDISLYPDPRAFGWTFTGSVEQSLVEFYEKSTNMGIVKLDFYYTTATMKTVLEHPSTGRNQLFRNRCSGDLYCKILQNPRAHTGRGYRTASSGGGESRGGDDDGDIDMDMDMVMDDSQVDIADIDEFDVVPTTHQRNIDTDDMERTGTNGDHQSANTTYYAKNDNYDFQTQGHVHRRNEMNRQHQTDDFNKWKNAAKREWAVVHAKFYVSMADVVRRQQQQQRRRTASTNHPQNQRRQHRGDRRTIRKKEPLPDQSLVIDVKAAEKATLGTDFRAVPSSSSDTFTHSRQQPVGRSKVRMKRIQGLIDDDDWKSGPLFECKLYYRAEKVLSGTTTTDVDDTNDDDDEIEMEAEQAADTISQNSADEVSLATKLRDQVSLDDYRIEKSRQVTQYHIEYKSLNSQMADEMLENCRRKISSSDCCTTRGDIDELVKIYFDELVRCQFHDAGVGAGAGAGVEGTAGFKME